MMSALLDCFFPRKSLLGEEGNFITADELRELRIDPIFEPAVTLYAQGLHSLDFLYAALPYEQSPLIRQAVWNFKYRRLPAFARIFAALMTQAAPDVSTDAVLCPVPLHWRRRFERGFNQATLLAEAIGATRNIGVRHLLRRPHATGHQAQRNRTDRWSAMSNAFVCEKESPTHVILIDDLATTGATLAACAPALKARGAARVEAWVLARGGAMYVKSITRK